MDYLERAQLLGQDTSALKLGKTITSTVTVNSLADFKKIFGSDITANQRTAFVSKEEVEPSPLNNLMNNVFGEQELTEEDNTFAKQIFPVKLQAVSAANLTINKDLVIGPSAAPTVYNVNLLTFAGGSLTVESTAFQLHANQVIVNSPGGKPYSLGILGTKVATQPGTGAPGPSYAGPAGAGASSNVPSPGICTGARAAGNGNPGRAGHEGGTGHHGANGLPSMPANIVINAYDQSTGQPLKVFTQSGPGGDGGPGGPGGPGQTGGKGGNGCNSGCEGTNGGNGNTGGTGGTGGFGGNGGNGVNGNNVTISFPAAQKSLLQTSTAPALPGKPGQGGTPGQPGAGGGPGAGGKHASNGSPGGQGGPGSPGNPGQPGTKTGTAGTFLLNFT